MTGPTPNGPAPDAPPQDSPDSRVTSELVDPALTRREPYGLTRFTIEGRRAPGLFVAGWLATLVGVGLIILTALGVIGIAGTILWIIGLIVVSVGLFLLAGSQTVERRAVGAAYAGPSPILVFAAVVALSRLAGYVVGLPLQAIGADIPRPVGDLLAVLLQALVFIGTVRLLVVGPGALSWRDMGLVANRSAIAQSVLAGAFFAPPVILVTSLVAFVAVPLGGVTPDSPLPPTGTTGGLLLHLLAAAVIAPIAEEVMFRGFSLTAWRRTLGVRSAIVRSSVIFVLAHVLFVSGDTFRDAAALAFVGGVVRIPIAFALGWLFVRTGSLWGPIGLHGAFNAILVIISELALRA